VTDHGVFNSSLDKISPTEDVLIVRGMEVKTNDVGDILGLFLEHEIESRTFESVIEEIRDQGGISVLPHPYRYLDEVPSYVLSSVDAVEGLNARSHPEQNERARTLAKAYNMTMLGGSDAHTPWEIGKARSVIDRKEVNKQDLKQAISDGRTDWRGTESPYYPTHIASYFMEITSSLTGFRSYRPDS